MNKKEYNPCGDLTGREREICNAATSSYFDMPFVEVMRNITLSEISATNIDENFHNAAKITDWSKCDLNDIEQRACVDFNSVQFETLSSLQIGLFKYLIHLLYENRYNIFYNRLVDFCADEGINLDEEIERKLNRAAQEADYFTSFNTLTENFRWTLAK